MNLWCTRACRGNNVGAAITIPCRVTIQVSSSVSAEEVWGGGLVDVLGTANDGDQEGCLEFSLKFLWFFLQHRDSLKCLAMSFSISGGGQGGTKNASKVLSLLLI